MTSGVTAQRATRPERSTAYNPLTFLGSSMTQGVRNARPFTPFPEAFGPTLVQGAPRGRLNAVETARAPLLNVREAAERLSVSPSTVYALCAQGKLAHVRVSNALRISVEAVEHFIHPDRKPRR